MSRISIETAVLHREAGLSVLPAARARKRPALGSWKTWSERLPTPIEVRSWFANEHDAVCIVTGRVSGNLECMDFDNKGELFEAWRARIEEGLLARLVVERTPSGGYHVVYRTEGPVEGNLKLARGLRDGKLVTLVETRGEGGLFLCAPTEGYALLAGSFREIPTISAEAREALLSAARGLDETPRPVAPAPPGNATEAPSAGFLERPGDDFAARGDIRPYLLANGWTLQGRHPSGNELWRRPGKNAGGHSATFDGEVFYVFSSNAAPFESERGYNLFQVYALLEHGGDFTAAARTLLQKGYGTCEDPLLGVDLSGLKPSAPAKAAHAGEDITIRELVSRYPNLREKLIHGFLRIGETMNIIAPPKTGKSWLVTDLALSVASGSDWFGFPCEKGKVLIIDNELHPETSSSRIPKVIAARGVPLEKVWDMISIVNQRGLLRSIEDIANHVEHYRGQRYKLIIIDAFYRAMPKGTDENDNGAIAGVYNLLDRFAQEIGCAFVLIHHTSKGNQSLKSVTDVGAGAGSQSRAADTHVILRRHREQGCVVMESVVRSFPSVEPICLRWNWPIWLRADELDPNDLEGKSKSYAPKRGAEQAVEETSFVERLPSLVTEPEPKTVFVNRVMSAFDITKSRARMLVEEALDRGYIVCRRRTDVDRGQRSTRFVYRGERRAKEDGGDEGDER